MRLTALLAATLLFPAVTDAKPRKKKAADPKAGAAATACGVKALPLAVGNTWTYNPAVAPLPPPDAIRRIAPMQPKQIVLTVTAIEAKDADTVVSFDEKFTIDRTRDDKNPQVEERTIKTTITCGDGKLDISPDSFLFAGEPGGFVGLELAKVERVKGSTSIVLTKGVIGENQWRDDLAIEWRQVPTESSNATLASGKLEMERQLTPQPPEQIATKMGVYRSEKIGIITTGRITVASARPDAKPMELPAGWISQLWLADDVGLVQALNSYGHMYQLVDSTLAK